ncbi:MAG: phosphoglycolate phosphatase [Mixta calida]|uniref:phosphoglycolate phosphatase n=1 Tax=Mixta TaxID=2100764 RepID=UPI000535B7EA|nr:MULTISPECIES: phosphoglycolate phosphatase [Mixta]AIX75629.1 phosphoglycolate phosphatase [Pantoea sp. PSNIH2]MBS6058964.1 phosphoglycolate phosphatase [Pantoea sp.]POU50615.1 phosphoglycolate phosphatase [Pantoea sp. PSNIH5]POU69168.1 phosphoglycolate phosphatase [Pantoea sp. PSNIH4]POY69165.1 phosphoglycolate phosphatase [Pantoea sp. PSNIH3]HCW46386.1 phosphoglycolate phosphatase [Erwiniaceae bacterium]
MARFTDIRALAFDLDGTLVDSVPGLADAIDLALNALQLPAAGAARVATWIGNGADVMVERALCWAQQRQPDAELLREARALFDKYYADTAEAGTTLFPHVAQTLEKLAAAKLPLALVTNKPTPFVAPLLRSLGIEHCFSLVIGGDDVAAKKPHPAPLFLVLGKFGLLPQELLFVGDSRNDILAAKAAGCPCVGMSFGYNYGEPIATSEPDLVLDDFNDLMPALGR